MKSISRKRKLENAFCSVAERRKARSNWRICCCIWSRKKNIWSRNLLSNIQLIVLLWKDEKQHLLSVRPQNFVFYYVHVKDWGCVCTCESIKGKHDGYQSVWLGEIGYSWSTGSRGIEALQVNHYLGRHLADTLCWFLSPRSWKGGVDYWALFWLHT